MPLIPMVVKQSNKILLVLAAVFLICSPVFAADDVQMTRDDKGVWFITGPDTASPYDIYEMMGYAVAQDRLWQAELFRRAARGRLAEIFGTSYLGQDILVRTTGYSEKELTDGFTALDDDSKAIINGYVAGFNRRIQEIISSPALLPFEFAAVGAQGGFTFIPHAWAPEDVLAWMALMLRNFDPEAQKQGQLDNAELYQTLVSRYGPQVGAGMFNDLRWVNDPAALTYIPSSASPQRTAQSVVFAGAKLKESLPPIGPVVSSLKQRYQDMTDNLKRLNAHIKMGSYAWVVDGNKTASGKPILYSGPQMGFTVPSIILEGSVRAGGVDISGMAIAGIPGIVIGRTPHHAWSMQVGHAHTVDYYLVSGDQVRLDRTETIKVAGAEDVSLPIYYTDYGPVVEPNPYTTAFDPETYEGVIVAWRYAHRNYEFNTAKAYFDLAKAESMDEFGAAIENVAVSQHFCYADSDGNIAYWMSGRDPQRVVQGDYRFPQGAVGQALDWSDTILKPRSTDRNTSRGYYCGWNNKTNSGYANAPNNLSYSFGPFHRAHVVDEYLSGKTDLTFEQIRNLALNIATTDSFGNGGNPWPFVKDRFTMAVETANTSTFVQAREDALGLLAAWDGHFVAGGPENWASGMDRADAWVLMDTWLDEVLRMTFDDELDSDGLKQSNLVLFNVLLHGLAGNAASLPNTHDWFKNSVGTAPQTADEIIVSALDTVLAALGDRPWGSSERKTIEFNHDLIGNVHSIAFSSRSTYAHCVEMGPWGPVKIESMFPLGESGDMRFNVSNPAVPVFNDHFFTMTAVYDNFSHRPFPLFEKFNDISGQVSTQITGQPADILGATITLLGTDLSVTTKADGSFVLEDILAGTYTLEIQKNGFDIIRLEDVSVNEGEPIQLDLIEMNGKTSTPGDSNADNVIGLEDAIHSLQVISGSQDK